MRTRAIMNQAFLNAGPPKIPGQAGIGVKPGQFVGDDLPESRRPSHAKGAAGLHVPGMSPAIPPAEPPCQAARTVSRNLSTSFLRRLLSPDSDCAAANSCEEAEPVSLAPRCTSVMLAETCCVPWAACCTLREISSVAAPCSSIAAAMVAGIFG